MIISLIVAMDKERGIGKNNQIPWYLPSDLKRFKALTMGHHILMGRKTYESIGRVLPGRIMLVISRNKQYAAEGCMVFDSLEKAIDFAQLHQEAELFIIGGSEIFSAAVNLADKMYITRVEHDSNADTFFPTFDEIQWETIKSEPVVQEQKDQFPSSFEVLSRKDEKRG